MPKKKSLSGPMKAMTPHFDPSKSRKRRTDVWAECLPLEGRAYFAAVFPTPIEQYELQLLNRARANPAAEVTRLGAGAGWEGAADLNEGLAPGTLNANPRQPLAFNPNLVDAARKHSQFMLDNQVFDHVVTIAGQKVGPTDRMIAAGYPLPVGSGGENLGRQTTIDDNSDALRLEQLLFVDAGVAGRGHRWALLNDFSNEVGLGVAKGTFQGGQFTMLTEDFANAGKGSFLTGVAFNDLNNDQFYQPGEQLGGVTITATRNGDGQVFTTTTWDAGGYSLKLDPGTYIVTATVVLSVLRRLRPSPSAPRTSKPISSRPAPRPPRR